jgi:hypothetical protein
MSSIPLRPFGPFCLSLAGTVVTSLRATTTRAELVSLIEAVTREMGFRYYALGCSDDLIILVKA